MCRNDIVPQKFTIINGLKKNFIIFNNAFAVAERNSGKFAAIG